MLSVLWLGMDQGRPLAQDGAVDAQFNSGTGITGSFIHALTVGPEGQILTVGSFTRAQGLPRNNVAQFKPDGALDSAFQPSPGANNQVLAGIYQPDGRVLIAGIFTRVNSTIRNRVARLNRDGSLDTTFDPGTGADGEVRCLALQANGKVLIGGPFTRFNSVLCNGIARLNTDGTLDPEFKMGKGLGGERFLDELRVLNDGKILIAGDFPTYNGVKRASIARLYADGSLDETFDPGAGAKPGDPILDLVVQPDGTLLLVGSFTSFNGKALHNLARLNPDGTLDTSFDPGAGTAGGPINGLLQSVALDADGKILIGGWFDRVDGVRCANLARLLPNGRPDTNWITRADAQVRSIRIQPDQRVVLGGDFNRINSAPAARLARLNASQPGAAAFKKCRCLGNGEVHLELAGLSGREYVVQVSEDLVIWKTWRTVTCGDSPVELVDPDGNNVRGFYRASLLQ